jgi:hypothetical protein
VAAVVTTTVAVGPHPARHPAQPAAPAAATEGAALAPSPIQPGCQGLGCTGAEAVAFQAAIQEALRAPTFEDRVDLLAHYLWGFQLPGASVTVANDRP